MKRFLTGAVLWATLCGFLPGQQQTMGNRLPYVGWGGDFQNAGPGTFTTVQTYFGFRAFTGYQAQGQGTVATNLIRASDSVTCDVKLGFWGSLDLTTNCSTASVNAQSVYQFCSGTTCSVVTMYDLSGSGVVTTHTSSVTQATAANRPGFTINCQLSSFGAGYRPCMVLNGTSQYLGGTMWVTMTNPYVMGATFIQTGNTGNNNVVLGCNNTSQHGTGSVNLSYLYAGTAVFTATGTTPVNLPHSTTGQVNSTSTASIMVDGALTTGLTSGTGGCSNSAGVLAIGSALGGSGSNLFAGDIFEASYTTGTMSVKGQQNGCANSNEYYGFGLAIPCNKR